MTLKSRESLTGFKDRKLSKELQHMKQDNKPAGCIPDHGITSRPLDTRSPHFKKRLPYGENRVIVANCRGITVPEVQQLIVQATGIELDESRISLEYKGFMLALPPNAVAFLLEGYLSQVTYEGRHLEILYSTVQERDGKPVGRPGEIVGEIKPFQPNPKAFKPPKEWEDADSR